MRSQYLRYIVLYIVLRVESVFNRTDPLYTYAQQKYETFQKRRFLV